MFSQGPQFVKEDAENCVVPEDVSVVIRVRTDRHRRRSAGLFKRYTRERNNIIVLRQFKQHLRHLGIALHNVSQTIERRIVQDVADNVRVDADCYSVHYSDRG